MQHDFRTLAVVLEDGYDVDVPAARPLTLKTATDVNPVSTEAGGRVYRWSSSQNTPSAEHARELAATSHSTSAMSACRLVPAAIARELLPMSCATITATATTSTRCWRA